LQTTTEKIYTKDDIGDVVEQNYFGIGYHDTIVSITLPDGQTVIGPRLKCATLFSQFSCIPAMEAADALTRQFMEDGA
jgi:hypothetical protein